MTVTRRVLAAPIECAAIFAGAVSVVGHAAIVRGMLHPSDAVRQEYSGRVLAPEPGVLAGPADVPAITVAGIDASSRTF
jgi:hypothetical protein